MRQSTNSVNRFVRQMLKENIPVQRWNDLNRDRLQLRKASNIIGFSLSTQVVSAFLISLTCLVSIRIFNAAFPGVLPVSSLRSQKSTFYVLLTLVYYFVYMFVPLILLPFLFRQNPLKTIPLKRFRRPSLFPLALVIAFAFYFLGLIAANLVDSLLKMVHISASSPDFALPTSLSGILVYLLMICVLAPCMEEFIFRGMILQNLREYGDVFAIVVSSLLFALLHGNLVQAPFAFVVGLALGYFALKFDTIWASVIIHCLINSCSTAVEALTNIFGQKNINVLYFTGLTAILIFACLSIAILTKKGFFAKSASDAEAEPMPAVTRNRAFFNTPGFYVFTAVSLILIITSLKIK